MSLIKRSIFHICTNIFFYIHTGLALAGVKLAGGKIIHLYVNDCLYIDVTILKYRMENITNTLLWGFMLPV